MFFHFLLSFYLGILSELDDISSDATSKLLSILVESSKLVLPFYDKDSWLFVVVDEKKSSSGIYYFEPTFKHDESKYLSLTQK